MTTSHEDNSHTAPNPTRRGIAALLGATGVIGAASTLAPSAEAATIARTDLANTLGFWPVLSDTAPSQPTMGNVPVLWLQKVGNLDTMPTAPIAPLFDDEIARYVIPTGAVGVQYKNADTGTILKPGSMTTVNGTLPQTVKIVAEALPGYVLVPGIDSSWNHTFIDQSKVSVLFSDTFSGSAGTGLSKRPVDNKLGGTTQPTWDNFWEGETFTLNGNNAIENQATKGWYRIDTGSKDMRLQFDMNWEDGTKANEYALFAVGGVSDGGGITTGMTPGGFRIYVPTKNGNVIIYSEYGNRAPNGTYTFEMVGSQYGIKTPLMSVMKYIDVTYVDNSRGQNPDVRGTYVEIRSDNTNAGVFNLSNMIVSKIGG